jgi:hypothetical protein
MDNGAGVVLALLVNVLFGAAGAWLAGRRNRNRAAWFAACFFFSWIALLILALLPKVMLPEGKRLSAIQDQAEIAADPVQLDAFGRNFDCMFRTARGPVIQVNYGNALAQIGDEFWLFPSLAIYRQVYQDNSSWREISNPEERRRFLALASRYLPRPGAA